MEEQQGQQHNNEKDTKGADVSDKNLTSDYAHEVLKGVEDPELHLDIVTLGLVYGVKVEDDGHADVTMTLTSPMCPYGPIIIEQVKVALDDAGFKEPTVDLTFNPPWEPSDEVKMMLGLL